MQVIQSSFFKKITNAIGGKHYSLAVWFAASGFLLAYQGKLTMPYMALAGVVQALVAGRSIATDYFGRGEGSS